MRDHTHLTTIACAAALLLGSQQVGSAFQNGAEEGVDLGSPKTDVPPLPKPERRDTVQPRRESSPASRGAFENDAAPVESRTERTPEEHAAAAKRLIDEGRYDIAAAAASQALAADPENADYLQIRARAYQQSGRYEQALADVNPLPVVTSREANLKSGNDVVARVPSGVELNVTEVRGDWLRVASVGDDDFKWAWVRKADVAQGRPRRVDLGGMTPGEFYGRYYAGPFYDAGRRSNFGRDYYDWTHHVPQRYWKYLPW